VRNKEKVAKFLEKMFCLVWIQKKKDLRKIMEKEA